MRPFFFSVTFTLCFSVLAGQEYVHFDDTHLILDNGVIHREIQILPDKGSVQTTFLSMSGEAYNFINPGSAGAEFRVMINGRKFNGSASWEFIDFDADINESGGEQARLRFRGMGDAFGAELDVYYTMYPELPVISKSIAIRNTSGDELKIEGIDVEALTPAGFMTSVELYTRYGKQKYIGPYEGDWDDPVLALHLPEIEKGMIIGNEAPGVLKRIAYLQDARDLCAGLTHPDQPYPFRKWLRPGESFQTPEVFILLYSEKRSPYEAMNFTLPDYVRKHMGLEIFKNPYKPVFVYNTWNPFRKNIDEALIKELADAAEQCGIKEFVIDDGWQLNEFTNRDAEVPWWYTQVGDYLVDESKFPNGLKPVFDDIKTHGMQPGLWLSIGSASTSSRVLREHPEWFSRDAEGALTNLHTPEDTTMRTACMSTGWPNHIKNVILALERAYGLRYTKLDFASVTSAYVTDPSVSGCYATDHSGHRDHEESFIVNYSGLFSLFDQLQAAAPDLFIDCTFETQGKLHLIDYAFMKHAEGNWLSNIEEPAPAGALRVRHLAWERTPALPASSLVIGNLRLDSQDLEFDFFSLLGTFPIMLGDIRETPFERRAWLKSWSEWIEKMQEEYNYLSFRQDLQGYGEPNEGQWDGWQRINTETQNGGIAGIFRQGSAEARRTVTINGLDDEATYAVIDAASSEILDRFSGYQLQQTGFIVEMERPYQGKIFEIKRLN